MENHNTQGHNAATLNLIQREIPNGTNHEAMEGARAGSAVRKTNCQFAESSGGEKINFGRARSVRDSPSCDDTVNRSNASVGAVTNGPHF